MLGKTNLKVIYFKFHASITASILQSANIIFHPNLETPQVLKIVRKIRVR